MLFIFVFTAHLLTEISSSLAEFVTQPQLADGTYPICSQIAETAVQIAPGCEYAGTVGTAVRYDASGWLVKDGTAQKWFPCNCLYIDSRLSATLQASNPFQAPQQIAPVSPSSLPQPHDPTGEVARANQIRYEILTLIKQCNVYESLGPDLLQAHKAAETVSGTSQLQAILISIQVRCARETLNAALKQCPDSSVKTQLGDAISKMSNMDQAHALQVEISKCAQPAAHTTAQSSPPSSPPPDHAVQLDYLNDRLSACNPDAISIPDPLPFQQKLLLPRPTLLQLLKDQHALPSELHNDRNDLSTKIARHEKVDASDVENFVIRCTATLALLRCAAIYEKQAGFWPQLRPHFYAVNPKEVQEGVSARILTALKGFCSTGTEPIRPPSLPAVPVATAEATAPADGASTTLTTASTVASGTAAAPAEGAPVATANAKATAATAGSSTTVITAPGDFAANVGDPAAPERELAAADQEDRTDPAPEPVSPAAVISMDEEDQAERSEAESAEALVEPFTRVGASPPLPPGEYTTAQLAAVKAPKVVPGKAKMTAAYGALGLGLGMVAGKLLGRGSKLAVAGAAAGGLFGWLKSRSS